MTTEQLKHLLDDTVAISDDPLGAIKKVISFHASASPRVLKQEIVLRALNVREAFGPVGSVLDALAREQGLFPYIENVADLPLKDRIAYAYHQPVDSPHWDRVFHRPQARVYRELMEGKNVILSAPTSFGKSLVIDALILSNKYDNVVVVVPTIALMDETRKRFVELKSGHRVITQTSQRPGNRNLFVFTQERVVEYPDFPQLDIFVIDEFYKLSISSSGDKGRAVLLNLAFRKLNAISKQFYLLGPSITGVVNEVQEKIDYHFIKEDYQTVVTQPHNLRGKERREERLFKLLKELEGPTLVFCSSPGTAERLVAEAISSGVRKPHAVPQEAIDWVRKNYHHGWILTKGLAAGMGMHHGKMPRSIAQYVVSLFNAEVPTLPVLFCTSTMIEGVNTKAENVVIFDNTINRRKYDYFTFNNICGRSGRMKKHFIGHVYLLSDPPQENLPFIDVPVLTQSEETPASLLVQLEQSELSPDAQKRVSDIKDQPYLSLDTIRKNLGVEPEGQISVAKVLLEASVQTLRQLAWNGFPTKVQLEPVFQLIFEHLDEKFHFAPTDKQLNMMLTRTFQLQSKKPTTELIMDQVRYSKGVDSAVQEVFDFMRTWAMHRLPALVRAVSNIQAEVLPKRNLVPGNYDMYAAALEHLFLNPVLVALDEYGIPLELARKLEPMFSPDEDVDSALTKVKRLATKKLTMEPFENTLILEACKYI